MNRRNFLALAALMPALGLVNKQAFASLRHGGKLIFGIFPGVGGGTDEIEEIDQQYFRDSAHLFVGAVAKACGVPFYTEQYRSVEVMDMAVANGSVDAILVPPTSAVTAMRHGYVPLFRMRDLADGAIIRRKASKDIKKVFVPQYGSWLDVMGRAAMADSPGVRMVSAGTQKYVAKSLRSGICDAGALRGTVIKKLMAEGGFEVYRELQKTPDFTILLSGDLAQRYEEKIVQAITSATPQAIASLQSDVSINIGGFVRCTKSDYAGIESAMIAAGENT